MRPAAFAAFACVAALLAVQAPSAVASTSPCSNPLPGAVASRARTCVNPSQSVYDQLRQRLGADLSKALAAQQRLSASVDVASANVQMLTDEVTADESRVTDLQDQVAQLDQQIADLQSRIDVEREQVAAMARAMYRQPASFLDIIASSGNLADALTSTADLIVAGQRAHTLQENLQSDLAKVQADRDARQSDLDQENTALAQVQAGLDELSAGQARLDDLESRLADLITQIQAAAAAIHDQPADVTATLALLIEQTEQRLIREAYAAAWAQANANAGLVADLQGLPEGSGPAGVALSWPLIGGKITQGFGPTSFTLEPPYGSYAHFHTGIDIAAALGSPVLAAAGGIVVAVAHTKFGYGNYVIIAHGSGVLTLYGHLLETDVTVGERVVRTQQIGREGSTGYSTGPHLHFEVRVDGQFVNPMRYLPPL